MIDGATGALARLPVAHKIFREPPIAHNVAEVFDDRRNEDHESRMNSPVFLRILGG